MHAELETKICIADRVLRAGCDNESPAASNFPVTFAPKNKRAFANGVSAYSTKESRFLCRMCGQNRVEGSRYDN